MRTAVTRSPPDLRPQGRGRSQVRLPVTDHRKASLLLHNTDSLPRRSTVSLLRTVAVRRPADTDLRLVRRVAMALLQPRHLVTVLRRNLRVMDPLPADCRPARSRVPR